MQLGPTVSGPRYCGPVSILDANVCVLVMDVLAHSPLPSPRLSPPQFMLGKGRGR